MAHSQVNFKFSEDRSLKENKHINNSGHPFSKMEHGLDDYLSVCLEQSEKNPSQTFSTINACVSRLTGIDVEEVKDKHGKKYKASYETKKDTDEHAPFSGGHPFFILPQLIHHYFQILFLLVKKDFAQFINNEYTAELTRNPEFYNQIVGVIKREIVIALECLNNLREIFRIEAITDTKQRQIQRENFINQFTQRVFALNENEEIVFSVGSQEHVFYVVFKKIKLSNSANVCIQVVIVNTGLGVSPTYPKDHPHFPGQHHFGFIEGNNIRFIHPRVAGIADSENDDGFKNYLLGLMQSYYDYDTKYSLKKIHDYAGNLKFTGSHQAFPLLKQQLSNNCGIYNYHRAQELRLPKNLCEWLFANELQILKNPSSKKMDTDKEQVFSQSFNFNEFFHAILKTNYKQAQLLDCKQAETIFNLLSTPNNFMSKKFLWSEEVNDFVIQLKRQQFFYVDDLAVGQMKSLIKILQLLPAVTKLNLDRAKLSMECAAELLAFVKDRNCRLESVIFNNCAIPGGIQKSIDQVMAEKGKSSGNFFRKRGHSHHGELKEKPNESRKRKGEDAPRSDQAKRYRGDSV